MAEKQFAAQVGALRAAVGLCAAVTERRNTIPVLSHLYLAATGGQLTVIGSDCDMWVTAGARGEGALDPTTADAARLAGLLALLPAEETVSLSRAREGQLVLTSTGMKARLFTLPAEDFPKIPLRTWKSRWSMPAGKLRALFDRTIHAISTEETRYYLNGVYLHVGTRDGNRVLHAAATDGHRLMTTAEELPQGDDPVAMIVPRKTAHQLRALLARVDPAQSIRVRSDDTTMDIEATGWRLVTKSIDGVFPDYQRVIPPELTGEPLKVLNVRRFADAVRTTRAISDQKAAPVRIGADEGMSVKLDATAGVDGDCMMSLPSEVATWGSNGAKPSEGYGFQARYLLDACSVFRQGFEIRVGAGEPSRISGPEGLAVLMPMRF